MPALRQPHRYRSTEIFTQIIQFQQVSVRPYLVYIKLKLSALNLKHAAMPL